MRSSSRLRSANVSPNDYVEIRGGTDADGGADVVASLLERDDVPDDLTGETELRGFVESVGPPIRILGVTIRDQCWHDVQERERGCRSVRRHSSMRWPVGTQVDVDGTETSATVIVADEVELED